MAFPAHKAVNIGRALLARIWGKLIGRSGGVGEVAQITPLFSAFRIRNSDHSIVHPHNILTCEKEKMSQHSSHNVNSFNSHTAINVSNNLIAADDRSNILTWLSPLDPKSRHQDIQDGRVDNIGEWLLRTEEFRSWRAGNGEGKSDNAVLFCYGNPGVGKTYIR